MLRLIILVFVILENLDLHPAFALNSKDGIAVTSIDVCSSTSVQNVEVRTMVQTIAERKKTRFLKKGHEPAFPLSPAMILNGY